MNEAAPDDQRDPAPARVDEETRGAERRDAEVPHRADRPPTADEERIADDLPPADPEVAAHYEEMSEIGASLRGEGEIEG